MHGLKYYFPRELKSTCNNDSEYFFSYFHIIKKLENKLDVEYFKKKCRLENKKENSKLIEYLITNNKLLLPKKKTKNIDKGEDAILLLQELVSSFDKKGEYKELKPYLKKSKKIKNSFYKLLLELAISLKVGNNGWANRIVNSILKINAYEFIVNPVTISIEEGKYIRLIEVLLSKYLKETKRELHTQMLANLFFHFGQNNAYKVLVNRFNSLWPLQEVREIIKKTKFANNFFDFWYIHLLNRTSDNNIRTLMRSMLNTERIRSAEYSQLWLFRYYFPGEPKLRSEIVNKLIQAWESKSVANHLVVINTMENSILKRDLAKINNYFEKPLFQIKREFYNNQLKKSQLSEFAIYQLTLLGDTNPENLWELIQ